jgi:hypothetical protein
MVFTKRSNVGSVVVEEPHHHVYKMGCVFFSE